MGEICRVGDHPEFFARQGMVFKVTLHRNPAIGKLVAIAKPDLKTQKFMFMLLVGYVRFKPTMLHLNSSSGWRPLLIPK